MDSPELPVSRELGHALSSLFAEILAHSKFLRAICVEADDEAGIARANAIEEAIRDAADLISGRIDPPDLETIVR